MVLRIAEWFYRNKLDNDQSTNNNGKQEILSPFWNCFARIRTELTKGYNIFGIHPPFNVFRYNKNFYNLFGCWSRSSQTNVYQRALLPHKSCETSQKPAVLTLRYRQLNGLNAVASVDFLNNNKKYFEKFQNFCLSSAATGIATAIVYPTDLVKTRVQNQIGREIYDGTWDCLKKVIRREGYLALYKGLGVKLVAIISRSFAMVIFHTIQRLSYGNYEGSITLNILSGASAGAAYVVLNTPFEIVKTRLQVVGEVAGKQKISPMSIVRQLAPFGLFKGSTALLMRDIPYGVLYFNFYNYIKMIFADEQKYVTPGYQYFAAMIASIPATLLMTPSDVIKTRMMAAKKPGRPFYIGFLKTIIRIYHEEGSQAFWKGSVARIIRTVPQTGISLIVFEMLYIYLNFDENSISEN